MRKSELTAENLNPCRQDDLDHQADLWPQRHDDLIQERPCCERDESQGKAINVSRCSSHGTMRWQQCAWIDGDGKDVTDKKESTDLRWEGGEKSRDEVCVV